MNTAVHTPTLLANILPVSPCRDVLSLGKSRPWTEALLRLTGGKSNKMEVEPILEYFAPLQAWLESQNRGQLIGWSESPLSFLVFFACPRYDCTYLVNCGFLFFLSFSFFLAHR